MSEVLLTAAASISRQPGGLYVVVECRKHWRGLLVRDGGWVGGVRRARALHRAECGWCDA